MGYLDYAPTAELSDEEGRALLKQLSDLWGLTEETWDKVRRTRRGSPRDRAEEATRNLQKALIDATGRFQHREEFTAWLCRNHSEFIEAYDPLRMEREMVEKVRMLEWEVKELKLRLDGADGLIMEVTKEYLKLKLRPEAALAE